MSASFQSRLAKLESRSLARRKTRRGGVLFLLPKDYVGEKHVVLGRRMSTEWSDHEWCNFEEVPGPGPNEAEGINVIPIAYADRGI